MGKTTLTGFSTYGESIKPIEQPATETVTPTETAPTETVTPPEISESSVTNDGVITPTVDIPPVETKEEVKPTEAATDVMELDFPSFETQAEENKETSQQSQQISWKDILKNIDKKEVLKELGLTDFAIELNEHQLRGGDPADYLAAKAIDWNKVSDLDAVKDEYKNKYPTLSTDQIGKLISKEYSLSDTADDEERELGSIKLQADAGSIRAARIQHQNSFKIAEPIKVQQQQAVDNNAEIERQNKINLIQNSEAVKNLLQSKRVAIPLGKDDSFNFDLKTPDVIVRAMTDASIWQKLISNDKGEPDASKLIRIVKYAANMDAHDLALFNYGKSKGHRIEIEKGQNAKRPLGKTAVPESETLKDAFKNRARVSTYGTPA